MDIKRIKCKADIVFKFVYLILAIITFNAFTDKTAVSRYYTYIVFAFGVIVFLLRFFSFKDYKNTKGLFLLIAFSFLSVVSALINFRYGGKYDIIENLQSLVWMLFSFFILYAYDVNTEKSDIKKEFKLISYFLLFYNIVAAVISILMMANNYIIKEVRDGALVLGGFLWNRLWGIYTDPNHGSILAAICVIISLYYISNKPKAFALIVHIINIFLSLIYIACSDSRTGLVSLISGIVVFVYLYLVRREFKFIKIKGIKYIFCVFMSLIIASTSLLAVNLSKNVISEIRIKNIEISMENENLPENVVLGELTIGRHESENNGDLSEDISNRRFGIWKSGLEIFAKAPLFGTSFRGMISFAKEVLPDTYILNNDAGVFNCMHNSLLDVLVGQGIIGFAVFIAFAILILVNLLKGIKTIKDKDDYLLISSLASIIFLIAVSSLFLSQIVYINSIGGIVFWMFLGYAMNYLNASLFEEKSLCRKSAL